MDIKKLTAPNSAASTSATKTNVQNNVQKEVKEQNKVSNIFESQQEETKSANGTYDDLRKFIEDFNKDQNPNRRIYHPIDISLTKTDEPKDGDLSKFFQEYQNKEQEPKIKAKRTKVETVDTPEGKKTVTTEEDVEVSVDEYKKMLKDKLEGKEEDPNNKYEFDEDSVSEAMWKTSDKDGDGYIDETEYKELLGSILDVENIENIDELLKDSEILNKLMDADKELDANGDGKFSRDEFNNSVVNHTLPAKNKTEEADTTEKTEEAGEANTTEAAEASEQAAENNSATQDETEASDGNTLFDSFLKTIKDFFDGIENSSSNSETEANSEAQANSDTENTKTNNNPFEKLINMFNNLHILDEIKSFFNKLAE